MKKSDGPSLSWPTPHTTPLFLPPEDPFPVLLRHNSTPPWEPDPALARRQRQQQAGTGHGRPERAKGEREDSGERGERRQVEGEERRWTIEVRKDGRKVREE